MLKIGDFSKLSRVSIRMLRHYDEIGLLTPAETDRFTGYRYYSETQLLTAARITSLRDMGFGLAAIAEILKCCDDPQKLEKCLSVKRAELRAEIEDAGQQLRLLDTAMTRLRKEPEMNYDVTIKEVPERTVASVRGIIPDYPHEHDLWMTLMKETEPLHISYADPCYPAAIFHDNDYKESDVDVEVQKAVRGSYPDTANVKFRTAPAVRCASVVFKGGYEQIGEVYEAVASWVRDNGYAFDGPYFNIYHVNPDTAKSPDDYVTEVCCPVKKK